VGRVGRAVKAVASILPEGRRLSEEAWWPRHRVVLVLLWLHVLAVPVFALVRGFSLVHGLEETSIIAAAGVWATSARPTRRVRVAAATLGLLSASAILVHLSGGVIEFHFHFFVMIPIIALYQDWFTFLLAIGYVLVHHGLMGALDPTSVYNHPSAIRHPWTWAAVHAFFVAGLSAVCMTTWRLNEGALRHRVRAEDDLRATLSLLKATLESTADGILVVNPEGAITTFNHKFLDMWRIPEEVMRSRDDDRAIGYVLAQLKDPDGFVAKVRQLYANPTASSFDELEFLDGRVFERYSQPQNTDNGPAGRVWSFRDITDRKRADEAKNLFLRAVSHELRTPLTSVVGYARTLEARDSELSAQARAMCVGRLVCAADRLERLVLNLLDLDRLARGILEPKREVVDMATLVELVVHELALQDHTVDVASEHVDAMVDPGMIERVVENLLANAAKHTPPGSHVSVRVSPTERGIELEVADNGPGVPDDLKKQIFEPFRQGTVPAHSPGTGIGLSLVARFAALHDGRAWVEDRPGGGASFRVFLPQPEIDQQASGF
jgi:signal transduction histidine kinase